MGKQRQCAAVRWVGGRVPQTTRSELKLCAAASSTPPKRKWGWQDSRRVHEWVWRHRKQQADAGNRIRWQDSPLSACLPIHDSKIAHDQNHGLPHLLFWVMHHVQKGGEDFQVLLLVQAWRVPEKSSIKKFKPLLVLVQAWRVPETPNGV